MSQLLPQADSLGSSTVNPVTGETLQFFPYQNAAQVESLLTAAQSGARVWAAMSVAERARVLSRAAQLLREQKAKLSQTITQEMGKPIVEAEGEIDKSAWNCEYVAEHAEHWLADELVTTNAAKSFVAYRPLGVVLSILPWNFPVWQVFRCAASALMAGNAFVLKHAPNVLRSAENITELMRSAGVPAGVFQHLHIPVDRIGDVIVDPRIAMVTFTGSPRAGAAVAMRAGASCKKSILELGGSDPFIVLEDADLDTAVSAAIRARFSNCGQVCLAAKRFIVVDKIAAEFEARFAEAIRKIKIGNPMDRNTQLGPMARSDLREGLLKQVNASIQQGARVIVGGSSTDHAGFYFEPTLLTNVDASMPVIKEETFGPVAPILQARSVDHALHIANDTPFGLAAMLWTKDVEKAQALAARLEVGSVFINGVTASDPRLPVGGIKLSGYGRELGLAGMRELVNIQTVWRA
jgi:acyl-CoA reductase-like NAD-dependent aldehyde dehydrogenase